MLCLCSVTVTAGNGENRQNRLYNERDDLHITIWGYTRPEESQRAFETKEQKKASKIKKYVPAIYQTAPPFSGTRFELKIYLESYKFH